MKRVFILIGYWVRISCFWLYWEIGGILGKKWLNILFYFRKWGREGNVFVGSGDEVE